MRVTELSSFSKAADDLGLQKASVSLAIGDLESNLGTQLLHRTTRKVQTTADGLAFYERCHEVLAAVDEAEGLFQKKGEGLKGRIRFDMSVPVARSMVIPRLPEFLNLHPAIELEISSTDRKVDLIREGFDCVLRTGTLGDSGLMVKNLGHQKLMNCVSPGYLKKYGTPKSLEDLGAHLTVRYAPVLGNRDDGFEYHDGKKWVTIPMRSLVTVNNADAYMAACLAGLGIIQNPEVGLRKLIASGELVEILPKYRAAPMPISLLYPQRRHLAPRVQVFMDWLVQVLREAMDLD